MPEFILPSAMREEIIEHARREAPRECCGVIAGRSGVATRLYALRNIAEGNRLYEIDPVQLMKLEFEDLERENAEIVAIYHSHPETEAYPSRTDIELAFWPQAVYLICSLADPERPSIRGFTIRDAIVHEVSLGSDP